MNAAQNAAFQANAGFAPAEVSAVALGVVIRFMAMYLALGFFLLS